MRTIFPYLVLLLGYMAGQLGYYALGVRYDASALPCLWQVLDLTLLRERFLESLWFQHSQPPLFNLLIGFSLRAFGESAPDAWWLGSMLLGYLVCVMLYELCCALGAGRKLALGLSLLFVWSPPFILYEHFLFYTHIELFLLILSAWLISRAGKSMGSGSICLFFLTIALLTWLRGLYHLGFLVLLIVWLIFERPRFWKRILLCCLPGLLLSSALYVKNYKVFGTFSSSSWLGMNLANNLRWFAAPEKMQRWVREGQYDPVLLSDPFSPLSSAELSANVRPEFESIPALSYLDKTAEVAGADAKLFCSVNFNHHAYLARSKLLLRQALLLYREHPRLFLIREVVGWNYYFYPSSRYRRLLANTQVIPRVVDWYERLLGRIPLRHTDIDEQPAAVYLVLLIGLPLIFVASLLFLPKHYQQEQRLLLWFLLGCILYVSLVSNAIEVPENNRFRYPLEPMFLCLFGGLVTYVRARLRARQELHSGIEKNS